MNQREDAKPSNPLTTPRNVVWCGVMCGAMIHAACHRRAFDARTQGVHPKGAYRYSPIQYCIQRFNFVISNPYNRGRDTGTDTDMTVT